MKLLVIVVWAWGLLGSCMAAFGAAVLAPRTTWASLGLLFGGIGTTVAVTVKVMRYINNRQMADQRRDDRQDNMERELKRLRDGFREFKDELNGKEWSRP